MILERERYCVDQAWRHQCRNTKIFPAFNALLSADLMQEILLKNSRLSDSLTNCLKPDLFMVYSLKKHQLHLPLGILRIYTCILLYQVSMDYYFII